MDINDKYRFEFAKELIKKSGEFLRSIKAERTNINIKAKNDFVTQADKDNEAFITSNIHKNFPNDGIFGEESGKTEGIGYGRWIIDPIDGTVNFMNGFPNYTISIAYENLHGELTFGLVYCVEQDELFCAYKGEGAFLNGEKLTIVDSDVSKGLALCVYPHRRREMLDYYQERMRNILDFTSDLRSIGSAALSLCYVAASRCILYYEMYLAWYDIAAGLIILEEAGGCVKIERENDYPIHIAASAPCAFDKLCEAIK